MSWPETRSGLPAVLFCIVTGAAPLAAMMFNVPVAVSGGGYAVPAAFLVATIALTIFSTGYIEMSRRVTSTGGFYTFISRGLGNVMGLGAGILIGLCYVIFAAAVTGVLGYFASTSIEAWFGISLPAWVYMFAALALMTGFAFFHIELTARILGVALICEVLALVVLCDRDHHHRRPRRLQRRAAEPGQPVRQRGRHQGLRRRRHRRGHLRRVLVLGRLRDGAQLRRGVARPAQDRQVRDVRLA